MTKTACCTGVETRIQGWDVPRRQGEQHRLPVQGRYLSVESSMMPRVRAVVAITAVLGKRIFILLDQWTRGRLNSCLDLNSLQALQTTGDQVQSRYNIERGRILRVPGCSEPGCQKAGTRGDQPVRGQALLGAIPGYGLPIPRPLSLLPRERGGSQTLRHRSTNSHRSHV